MIVSYEKHLNDFLNREQSLQKIIKSQEEAVNCLNQKLSEKTEHLVIPLKMRYESEISLKSREILDLKNKLNELQSLYNDEKTIFSSKIQSNDSSTQSLQKKIEFEKQLFSQKIQDLESSLKGQISLLNERNQKVIEENESMREDLTALLENKSDLEILVDDFNNLQVLYSEKESDFLSETLKYKNVISLLRKNYQEHVLLTQKDKKLLQRRVEDMALQIKTNENDLKYELEQFKQHLKEMNKEFTNKTSEVLEIKSNKEKIINELVREKEDLENMLKSQREEFLDDLKKKDEAFDKKFELLSKEMILINEEKSNELERFIREIEILKNEKVFCQKNLQEIKSTLTTREDSLNSELIRQKIALEKLMELGQQRENFLQEEIVSLHYSMKKLKKSYDNKENMLSHDKEETKRLGENLAKLSETLKRLEEKINLNKNHENQKICELARENKMNLLTISEKMKEIEKLKVESFEKKTKEKPIIYQQYDRLAANFQSFNNNLPSLMDYLKGFLQINEENLQEGSFNVQDMENTSRYQDIEILKYEERIIKNEAELDLAKKGLELYMEHFKEMEERMESLNNENNEKLFSQQETLDLRLENNKLKEENKYLLDLNKKLEENIMNTFKKLELKASINKIEDKAITLCNNSKMMNSSERKTVKKTKGVEKINETKRVFKQILENLQIVQKNLVNFSGFENEIVKNLKENLKNSENRISQYEKIFEADLSTFQKRLLFFEEIISDPLNLTQKIFDELKQVCFELQSQLSIYHSRNHFNQSIWSDFESRIKKSPFLQEGEKNLFYQNEQQTISILRSETNSLYKILEQEKENHKNELENEIKNGGISKQLIEERIDSLKIELNHQKKQTEGLKNLMESVKKSHSKELKKMRLDLNNINKFITDKQNRFNEEKKKLTQEIQKHENNLYQKEQNYKKIYENKLIKFAENIEEKNKMINSKNMQNMQEESVYRKIEEEKEKKFLIEINSLKEELENLREMEQERETQSQNEKTLLKKINERFQLGLEKIHDEKQIFIDQINSLKDRLQNNEKMMREREKQFSVEMYKHYNN